jgi:hypothetical protein
VSESEVGIEDFLLFYHATGEETNVLTYVDRLDSLCIDYIIKMKNGKFARF